MSGIDPPARRRRLSLDAFRWGLIAGAVFPVAVWLALMGLLKLSMPGIEAPRFNVDMSSVGRDVTRSGGRRVIFANERGSVVQSCNGACDDVRLQESSGDNSYWVRVLDAQGRCVACSRGGYVTNGYGSEVTRLRIDGTDALDIRESYGRGAERSVKISDDPQATARSPS